MKSQQIPGRRRFEASCDILRVGQIPLRSGVTVVELLVVIGTISLLASLLIPAVQSARASSRMMQCRNNLHQFGVAAHSFHEDRGFLLTEGRPLRSLLPGLGEAALAERLDRNDFQQQVSPAVFVCPDDVMAERSRLQTNYAINYGHGFSEGSRGRGLENGGIRFSQVTDGLSNTAFLSEQLVLLPEHGAQPIETGKKFPLRYRFETLVHFSPGQEDAYAQHCLSDDVRRHVTNQGRWTSDSLYYDSRHYDHLLPPNCWSFSNRDAEPHDGIRYSGGEAANSLHPGGGVNLLWLDGSVSFVSSGIDIRVYRAMGSIAGGETGNSVQE